jgi:hypothetical protein
MTLRDLARSALSTRPAVSQDQARILLNQAFRGSTTLRLEEGGQAFTVVWEFDGLNSRVACTCGKSGCEHGTALLLALAGGTDLGLEAMSEDEAEAPNRPSPHSITEEELAESTMQLVRQTCALGLGRIALARDAALDRLLDLLRDQDQPDLKRAVALLRRVITSPAPSPSRAVTALLQLSSLASRLRECSGCSSGGASGLTKRREEVRLLEVARDTQRTPFGERRDISYFLDLDDHMLLREVTSCKPGSPSGMSEGPFPKMLIGNLVAVEAGPPPPRLRLLQYASAGYPADSDLDHLMVSSQSSVEAIYREYGRVSESEQRALDELVIFAPDRAIPTSTGVVLADESMALLPLARAVAPSLCGSVDLLERQGAILAVIGPLVLAADLLTLLPLSVLIEIDGIKTLRRLR